jgi:hypothetical protein
MRKIGVGLLAVGLIWTASQDALPEHVAEFVIVTPGGIIPDGAVATMADISSNIVVAVAAEAAAQAAAAAAAEVQVLVDDVTTLVNALEGVGYIRGYLLDFGVSGSEANTNVTASIIRYTHNVSNDVNYVYSDVFTYFSEEPASLPVVRWSSSPRHDAVWEELTSVAVSQTQIVVGATLYDCFRNTVRIPVAQASAFYRVFADAQQQQVGAFLPVRNGIRVGNETPLSVQWTEGTNTWRIVGGVFCVPND